MATLGTQNISTSYPQVLKTVGTTPFTGTLLAVASGDESSTSALQISTTGVKSSGTFAVDGASLLSGNVTLGGSFTLSTGTATLGTASISTATISTATISTATIPLQLSTVSAYNAAGTTNGTVALTGVAINDIVIGSLNSLGSATGSTGLIIGFHPIASNVVRYSITNPTTTAGTVPAGVLHMTALRLVP
jgi:hypothetical protein